MWVKLPLCLGWNSLPAGFRWDVGRVGGIELCFPPNSMVPCEPALQLSMWISFPIVGLLDKAEVWTGMYQMDLHWEKEIS